MKTTVTATDFKARCLALLDEIEKTGEPITVTRRGRPVATLGPVPKGAWRSPANSWKGKIEVLGDIVNTDFAEIWDATQSS